MGLFFIGFDVAVDFAICYFLGCERYLFLGMNCMVSVPGILSPTPCVNLPNSLAREWSQISLSSLLMRCWYSLALPMIGFMTVCAHSWKVVLCFGGIDVSLFQSFCS